MKVDSLANHQALLPRLAAVHFDLWGPLTGQPSLMEYEEALQRSVLGGRLPTTIVALEGDELLGSVNLVECDLPAYEQLTPWMGQLFVLPDVRAGELGRP